LFFCHSSYNSMTVSLYNRAIVHVYGPLSVVPVLPLGHFKNKARSREGERILYIANPISGKGARLSCAVGVLLFIWEKGTVVGKVVLRG
jgi:hypothetical protein